MTRAGGIMVSLFVLVCVGVVSGRDAVPDDRSRAQALWEQAIAAKGGRERLSGIQSFALKEQSHFDTPRRPDMATGLVEQIVAALPDLWWSFEDYRPGKMGYSVAAVNTATGQQWANYNGKPARTGRDRSTGWRLRQLQYVYFLETRWVRPTPLRASRVRVGLRSVDRIETDFDGQAILFDLDVDTHLPMRIESPLKGAAPAPQPGATGNTPATPAHRYIFELSAYHDVGGIQVPGRVTLGGDAADVEVEINPDYDPSIFTTAPPPEAGLDSWRKRR